MRPLKLIRYILLAALFPVLLLLNWSFYSAPSIVATSGNHVDEPVLEQLRYLENALRDGAGERMQEIFPEGYVFSHVLFGLSSAEVARRDSVPPDVRRLALEKARWALERIESPAGRAPFPPELNPPYGMFYAGWRTLLRAKIVEASFAWPPEGARWDSVQSVMLTRDCDILARAFDSTGTPFLQSYRGSAWPADALVGVSALSVHDRILPPRYTATIAKWLADALERRDPDTGLIPHAVDAVNGYPLSGARGSSQSLMLRLLADVEPALALQQYRLFRALFVARRVGLPGILEYPEGTEGSGDVDSGPLVLGLGASATVVAIGTAQTFGDEMLAEPLNRTIEALGFPLVWSGERWYLLGQLPVLDAFLVWSRLARPVAAPVDKHSYQPVVGRLWLLPVHGVSLLLVIVLLIPELLQVLRRLRLRRTSG